MYLQYTCNVILQLNRNGKTNEMLGSEGKNPIYILNGEIDLCKPLKTTYVNYEVVNQW